jgi:hypothetical protein
MWYEGAEVDEDHPLSDWISRTGAIPKPLKPRMQNFWWWTPEEFIGLGTEDVSEGTEEEIWQRLRWNDNRLGLRNQYGIRQGPKKSNGLNYR